MARAPIDVDLPLSATSSCETIRLTLSASRGCARAGSCCCPLLELDPALASPTGTKLKDALDALREGPGRAASAPRPG